MKDKLFIDANIIIDWIGDRKPFYSASAKLFSKIELGKIIAITNPLILATCYYLFAKSSSKKKAKETISQARNLFELAQIDATIFDKALKSTFNDFEDGIHYYSALEAKAHYIITRNQKDFKISTIKVLSAEEYLTF